MFPFEKRMVVGNLKVPPKVFVTPPAVGGGGTIRPLYGDFVETEKQQLITSATSLVQALFQAARNLTAPADKEDREAALQAAKDLNEVIKECGGAEVKNPGDFGKLPPNWANPAQVFQTELPGFLTELQNDDSSLKAGIQRILDKKPLPGDNIKMGAATHMEKQVGNAILAIAGVENLMTNPKVVPQE
jgi:hypothetical protein